jgi:membrane fusion protein (multidrug efflux system)
MRVGYILTGFGLLGAIGALFAIKGAQIRSLIAFGEQAVAAGPPPEAVGMTEVMEQNRAGTLTAVGSIAAARGVVISNEAPGTVTRILFESGNVVKKGQLVLELDTSVERAQLASALARRELATSTAARSRKLLEKSVITKAQGDNDDSAMRTASADVEAIQAQIARKTVRAPFAGKLGIRQVSLGQYLGPGTPITVLESLGDLYVDFTLPQQMLSEVAVGMPVLIELGGVDAPPMNGAISAVDPTVDQITRTIKLRASMPKQSDRLRSGMFVKVTVVRPEKKRVIMVPTSAVVHAPYGDSVFVVEERKPDDPGAATTPDGKPVKHARQQFVKVGESVGDFTVILDGVEVGQQVVSSGAFKLRNNASIYQAEVAGPSPTLAPQPKNR